MSSNSVDMDYWNSFWSSEVTPWHKNEPHPKLIKYLDLLTTGGEDQGKKRTFFFPLCGKSVDMKHVYGLGHRVVGTEGSEEGCRQFFKESGLEWKVEEEKAGFKIFMVREFVL